MAETSCPHCGGANPEGSAYCGGCGKALPQATSGGPRIVTGAGVASTATGKTLQEADLIAKARKAAVALLVVTIMQFVFGTILIFVLPAAAAEDRTVMLISVYGIGVIFLGLYLWARKNPLPAAISGLVFFITVHALDAVADPTALARGVILKVIVIVMLVQAIQAGIQHRKLRQQVEPDRP